MSGSATAHTYHRELGPVQWGIMGVSVVEAVVISLVLHRWPILAWSHLAMSLIGIAYAVWYMVSLSRNPHEVDDEVLRLRYRHRFDIELPRHAIARVRRVSHNDVKRTFSVREGVLRIAIGRMTNVRVEFAVPAELDLPGLPAGDIEAIEFFADDPGSLIRELTAQPVSA
ncbi:hypothetical protein EK0264_04590 [Epidermidibacterium keratini]|uniref:Uncharacterized protein n=1 Tax=Epidermidibacterium keratini TaxID=1891644 RepID=A0A7L4YLC1_9ACTN|nr:hypothetical protein [Epidermidibacterium keratini]QHB99633.1 hypothetical protein EK0264_04590 [Epidermidibacterium keratini]